MERPDTAVLLTGSVRCHPTALAPEGVNCARTQWGACQGAGAHIWVLMALALMLECLPSARASPIWVLGCLSDLSEVGMPLES